MKKKRAVLAALGLVVGLLLAGCAQKAGGDWKANENSIYVTRTQEVQSALVYTSDQSNDLYTQEGLKAFAEEAVKSYNEADRSQVTVIDEQTQGKLPVSLKSCTLADRTGTLVFEYASPEDYERFAQETGDNTNTIRNLFIGKGTDAETAEHLPDLTLAKKNGKIMEPEKVLKEDSYVVVVLEGAGTICTEGGIVCMASSASDTVQRDDFTVVTGEGTHCIVFK